jgi:predicted dinucleotide-binding enzyme
MTVHGITTIGLIGAGNIGSQLARLGVQHGYQVVLSNSRGPETLADLVAEIGEGATAGTAEEAAAAGDVVVVTIPLKAIGSVPVAPLDGKIVIDTNNYYPQRDGRIARLDAAEATTAGLLQEHLPGSKVVKAFNHIGAADLTTKGSPAGTAGRRALAVYGDDADARATVSAIIDEFGFEPVDGGPLSESWRIERDQPGYVQPDDRAGLEHHLTQAQRDVNVNA